MEKREVPKIRRKDCAERAARGGLSRAEARRVHFPEHSLRSAPAAGGRESISPTGPERKDFPNAN